MNYTNNYHLPQWVETDRIMMEDFNQMCSDIDEGIKTAQDTADTAESKADAAQSAATAAQTTASAAYCPTNKPYAVGHYKSDGTERHITVGFHPSAVLFHGRYQAGGNGGDNYSLYTDGSDYSDKLTFTDDGFTVKVEDSTMPYPNINQSGKTYAYLALR